jgi:hypothetical protein
LFFDAFALFTQISQKQVLTHHLLNKKALHLEGLYKK